MSFQLFDRLSAFFKRINVHRGDRLFTDQSSIDKLIASGDFINLGSQHALLEQTNLHINRLERYKDYDQMDEVGEITLALDLYADEASLIDPELKHSIMVKADAKIIKDEIEDLLYETLSLDNVLRPMIRYLCKYGDFPTEIVPTKNRDGVASLRFMNVYNFTRIETKYGDLIGFFYQDEIIRNPEFFHPWQVAHMRLTSYENIFHPYGRSLLNGARKHFKQLRLMEDAAIIYRLTRAPEKRVFTIPVGHIPTHEVPNYIEKIASRFKKKRFFDPATGDINERWHPLIQEDDFWLPQRPDGSGPKVETLPGAENLDQIADIEYFKKKMIAGLKIPFSRVGIGEPSDNESKSLSHVAPEFAKAVQWIQREVVMGLKKIAIIHLALRGYTEKDLKSFSLHMTASSAIDELYRIETWSSRADVIDALKGTDMFPDEWILKRFTDMTDDEIKQIKKEKEKAAAEGGAAEGGKGGGGGGGLGGGGGGLPPLPMPGGKEAGPPIPGEEGGEGAGEGGEGAGPPGLPPLEGYDYELERVLNEEVNKSKPIKKVEISEAINHKSNDKLHSGFEYLLNSGELDGLSKTNSNKQEIILIESAINRGDGDAIDAKNQMEKLLKSTQPESLESDGEIPANIDIENSN